MNRERIDQGNAFCEILLYRHCVRTRAISIFYVYLLRNVCHSQLCKYTESQGKKCGKYPPKSRSTCVLINNNDNEIFVIAVYISLSSYLVFPRSALAFILAYFRFALLLFVQTCFHPTYMNISLQTVKRLL